MIQPTRLHFTRDRLTVGSLTLVDVTVQAGAVVGDTVPSGTPLRISGHLERDLHLPWMAEAFRDDDSPTPFIGHGVHDEVRCMTLGEVALHDATFRFSDVLLPDGVLITGSTVEISGTLAATCTFVGWNDDPPQVIEAPTPRRIRKTVEHTEDGRIAAIIEEVE